MEKSGANEPTTVLDWNCDISSDGSYCDFEAVAELVYHIQ